MTRSLPIITLAAAILFAAPAHAADRLGVITRIIDADTFEIGGTRIRLCGIDAPERDTRTGRAAARFARETLLGRQVLCRPVGEGTPCDSRSRRTSRGRLVAQCFVGGEDVAAMLVRAGHACDWRRFSGGYYGRGAGLRACAR